MKSHLISAVCTGLFISAVFTNTQAATWGAEVGISTISPCPSYCGGAGGMFDYSTDGGAFSSSAYTSLSNADGNGQATASLTGPDLLPSLGAQGFSGPDSRTDSNANGMLGYIYTGASATTISLDLTLDGSAAGEGWAYSDVAVILGNVTYYTTHYPTFIYEVVPGDPSLSILGTSNMSIAADVGLQSLTDSISFTLNPGDQFFVWAGLNAGGIRGGYGDAFNTLSMSFSDSTGINAVPVPAAAWLFASGLLGLIGVARRKA